MVEGSCHCGKVHWRFDGVPPSATVCNCSVCRRYGAMWGYGSEGKEVHVSGPTQVYSWGRKWLGFHFCPDCGCTVYWRALMLDRTGHRRMGVNLRLAPQEAVRALPIIRHDTEIKGDLPRDGRCVADMWF
jgi:hypothetical protein